MYIKQGWLAASPITPSPNFNRRPDNACISLLVVHGISLPPDTFGARYIHDFFQNRLEAHRHPYFAEIHHLKVSAHCLINRAGVLTQFVNFDHRAWHAGQSSFEGLKDCNDYSIGIELEGSDNLAYTQAQYRQLAKLTLLLQARYPAIIRDRIVGHCDIAPGRKTDPGEAFDWSYFRSLLETA